MSCTAAAERRLMGVWVFDLAPDEARALYADLPEALKAETELRVCMNEGHLHVTSDAAADWLRERLAA
ncbi:MAG TPA: hypothetical protein PLF78_09395 [Caulobacter sp.]|nr:hypothetical protein [Caulobacter sp.]